MLGERMKKKKIWSSIGKIACALLVASSWVWFGVALALSNTTIKMGGGISFVANDVNATVTVNITGSTNGDLTEEFDFTPETKSTTNSWEVPTKDKNGNSTQLEFQDSATPITVTLTVTNNHTESRNLKVRVSASEIENDKEVTTENGRLTFKNSVGGTSVDNFTTTVIKGSSPATQASVQSTSLNEEEGVATQSNTSPYPFITNNDNQTFEIKMYYNAKNKNITTENSFKIEIKLMDRDYVEDASDYSELTFNKSSVSLNSSATHIYIPSQIRQEGTVYEVNNISTVSAGKLVSVFIPSSITSMDENVGWNSCSNLEYAYFENTTRPWYMDYESNNVQINNELVDFSDPTKAADKLTYNSIYVKFHQ